MPNVQVSCPRGHLYDSSLPSCPYCSPNAQNVTPTAPINMQGGGIGVTSPVNPQSVGPTNPVFVGPTAPVNPPKNAMEATQYIGDLATQTNNASAPSKRVRPVVGWLVCVQGPDIGKDFRLHTHFNAVGRDKDQDVCLSDEFVSREHFVVSYDMVNNRYFAEMGKGKTFVYINGYPLGGRTQLKKGDQIKVANSLLVFIPLEEQDVKWNWKI